MKPDVAVFVASTPLNALLCCALASQVEGSKLLLLIDQENHLAANQLALLSELEGELIDKVHLVGCKNKGIKGFFNKKKALKTTTDLLTGRSVRQLFMCNDRRIENQYLIKQTLRDGGQVTYVDDGWYTYSGKQWRHNKVIDYLSYWFKKQCFGHWVYPVNRIAESHHIDSVALLFPTFKPDYLSSKTAIGIEKDQFTKVLRLLWPIPTIDTHGENQVRNGKLLCLPHSSVIGEDILQYAADKSDDTNLYVKRHPRDKATIKGFEGVPEIDGAIPIERYLCEDYFSEVVCGASTVLLMALWFNIKKVECITQNMPELIREIYKRYREQ